jgi:antitoxin component of MazEF toxin-antitoxin module
MSTALQIIQIGDELGVILPDELIESMGLQVDDVVVLTPSTDGVALEFIRKPVGGNREEA